MMSNQKGIKNLLIKAKKKGNETIIVLILAYISLRFKIRRASTLILGRIIY